MTIIAFGIFKLDLWRIKMKLSKEEACEIINDDHEEWDTIKIQTNGNSRWSIRKSGIFKHLPTGKFYELEWSQGATEHQDERPFQYSDPDPIEVHQVERVMIVYEKVI
jgi:hypothetical protein